MTFPGLGHDTPFCQFPLPQRALLERYGLAFETADVRALVPVLAEDVRWEMPPDPVWFSGRDHVLEFLATRLTDHGRLRAIPAMANGQPAFALYARQDDGPRRPYALHVLTVTDAGISRIVSFSDPRLFSLFGMPPTVGP